MDFIGFHHFYTGLVLLLVAFLCIIIWQKKKTGMIIFISGFVILLDDFAQHVKQLTNADYRSILHKLYGKTLYKISLIRWLNNIVDRIFGKNA